MRRYKCVESAHAASTYDAFSILSIYAFDFSVKWCSEWMYTVYSVCSDAQKSEKNSLLV